MGIVGKITCLRSELTNYPQTKKHLGFKKKGLYLKKKNYR